MKNWILGISSASILLSFIGCDGGSKPHHDRILVPQGSPQDAGVRNGDTTWKEKSDNGIDSNDIYYKYPFPSQIAFVGNNQNGLLLKTMSGELFHWKPSEDFLSPIRGAVIGRKSIVRVCDSGVWALNSNGKLIRFISEKGEIRFDREVLSLEGSDGLPILGCRLKGEVRAAIYSDGMLRILDTSGGPVVRVEVGIHGEGYVAASINDKDGEIVLGNTMGEIVRFNSGKEKEANVAYTKYKGSVFSLIEIGNDVLETIPDGLVLVRGKAGSGGPIEILSLPGCGIPEVAKDEKGWVLVLCANGKVLSIGSGGAVKEEMKVATSDISCPANKWESEDRVVSVDISNDGKYWAVANTNGRILLIESKNRKEIGTVQSIDKRKLAQICSENITCIPSESENCL